jgi:hypothetical protein
MPAATRMLQFETPANDFGDYAKKGRLAPVFLLLYQT